MDACRHRAAHAQRQNTAFIECSLGGMRVGRDAQMSSSADKPQCAVAIQVLRGRQHIEFVALGVRKDHPGRGSLPNIDATRTHAQKLVDLGLLVIGPEV